MRDTELYQNLLGIVSPWSVESVSVKVTHPPKILLPVQNAALSLRLTMPKSGPRYRWTAVSFFNYLHAWTPRISCVTHGVRQVSVPPGPNLRDGSPSCSNA